MQRDDLSDLAVFLAVAEAKSFTRAAAKLGTSQSALSQAVRRFEERLGIRLLIRTTRNVAPTVAGQELLETLRPAFGDIETKLVSLGRLRERPAGTVRLTAGQHAMDSVLMPMMASFLQRYPDITVELSSDSSLTDIVGGQFDAGIRLGEQIAKDMIAVRIGPDIRMAVVAAPSYFDGRAKPTTPHDLTGHACINIRLPSAGGLYVWEFERDGREVNVRVEGRVIVNNANANLRSACDGLGLAIVMEDQALPLIEEGRLVRVLDDWCQPFSGYHIYYPSSRLSSPAFSALVDELRFPRRVAAGMPG